MASLKDIFSWFEKNDYPTQQQFQETWKSFWHKSERLPITQILGLQEEINRVTTNFKGYHTSLDSLLVENPQNKNRKDFYAWVGSPYPGTVYVVKANGGAWIDTGEVPTQQQINLAEYAKKQNEKGQNVLYSLPENMLYFETSDSEGATIYRPYIKNQYSIGGASGTMKVLDETTTATSIVVVKIPLEIGKEYVFTCENLPTDYEFPFLNFYSTENLTESRTLGIKVNEFANGSYTHVTTANTKFVSFYLQHDFGESYPIFDLRETFAINDVNVSSIKPIQILDEKGNDLKFLPESLAYLKKEVVEGSINYSGRVIKQHTISIATGAINPMGNPNGTAKSEMVAKLPLEVGQKYTFKVDGVPAEFDQMYLNFSATEDYTAIRTLGVQISQFIDGEYQHIVTEQTKYVTFYILHDFGENYPVFDVRGKVSITGSKTTYYLTDENDKKISLNIEGSDGGSLAIKSNSGEIDVIEPFKVYDNHFVTGSGYLVYASGGQPCQALVYQVEPNTEYTIDYGKEISGFNYLAFHKSEPIANNSSSTMSLMKNSGRRYVHFKTLNDTAYVIFNSHLIADQINNIPTKANYDVRDKVKMYKSKKIGYDIVSVFGTLKKDALDYTDKLSAEIEIPRYCKVNLIGNNLGINADTRIKFGFEYEDSNGVYFKKYSDVAWQGHGSLQYAKKNFKHKLTNEDGSKFEVKFGNWMARSSFHSKANAQDSSYTMNNGVADFFKYLYSTRPFESRYPWSVPFSLDNEDMINRFDSGAMGAIDGIPCLLYFNGCFYGVYTLNLNCFAENFNIQESDPDNFIYKSELNDCKFTRPNDKTVWEEVKTDKVGNEISDEAFEPMRAFTAWVSTANTSYPTELFNWIDKEYTIDYFLTCEFLGLVDNVFNNLIFVYYKGKFYPMFYDGDTGIGMWYNGKMTLAANFEVFKDRGSKLFDRFYSTFTADLENRYRDLRNKGVFTVEKFEEIFGGFANRYPFEAVKTDLNDWVQLPTNQKGNIQSVPQMVDWITKRLVYLDSKYNYN